MFELELIDCWTRVEWSTSTLQDLHASPLYTQPWQQQELEEEEENDPKLPTVKWTLLHSPPPLKKTGTQASVTGKRGVIKWPLYFFFFLHFFAIEGGGGRGGGGENQFFSKGLGVCMVVGVTIVPSRIFQSWELCTHKNMVTSNI